MHRIVHIREFGGACPTQLEGETDQEQSVYARFRHGFLRVDVNGETVFHKCLSDHLDGALSYDQLKAATRGEIEWPETCGILEFNEE